MANTIEYGAIFQEAMDAQVAAKSTSGWMESNAGKVIYNGGRDIKIPTVDMDGMGDYDRDKGYAEGSVSLSYETKTMRKDRGRKFRLDSMDVDETNFVANATHVMSEFQRTKVIPEIDAYRYSEIYAQTVAAGVTAGTYAPAADTMLPKLLADLAALEDMGVSNDEVVISMSVPCASIFDQIKDIDRRISVIDFARGGISLRVKSINNAPIIRVPGDRFKTAYKFNDGKTAGQEKGGFVADPAAVQINWIITPRNAPIAVSKTDKFKIFEPGVNQQADAYDINYRKYHDLWLTINKAKACRVSVSPAG
jgi:hypothetical protein